MGTVRLAEVFVLNESPGAELPTLPFQQVRRHFPEAVSALQKKFPDLSGAEFYYDGKERRLGFVPADDDVPESYWDEPSSSWLSADGRKERVA
jgi:hypothetical protein